MSTPPLNPTSLRFPFELRDQPAEVVQAHRYAFQGLTDLNQAIAALKNQVDANKQTITETVSTSGGVTPAPPAPFPFPGLGAVNNQTGNTSYTLAMTDNGALLIFGDASPVTLTLNSALTVPFFFFASNFGASNVTMTPSTGSINQPTLDVGGLYEIVFDGTNWTATAIITGGVTQLLAGFGISLSPSGGTGVVTINTDTHSESLTDGNSNFIFASGDIVTVVGVPN